MDLTTRPDDDTLIDIWQEAFDSIIAVCSRLDDDQWRAPTPCPGWSVGDIVAHLVDVEQWMTGAPRPEHEPPWETLPHATTDFGRLTELGVDYRRSRSRDEVLTELRDVLAVRRAQLDATPAGEQVPGPFGGTTSMERLLRMRILDAWMHEHDIRDAINADGNWDSRPAVVTFQQIQRAVPIVWSRNAHAPVGSTIRVNVTGPGIMGVLGGIVDEDGRGSALDPDPDSAHEPTVDITVSWPDLVHLSAGRVPPDDRALRSRLALAGDPALGEAALIALTITP